MFQLIVALTFLGMILTPAIVAAKSGKKEFDPEMDDAEQGSSREAVTFAPAPVKSRGTAIQKAHRERFDAPTLPLHGTLGLADR